MMQRVKSEAMDRVQNAIASSHQAVKRIRSGLRRRRSRQASAHKRRRGCLRGSGQCWTTLPYSLLWRHRRKRSQRHLEARI